MSITELFNLLVPDVFKGIDDAAAVARYGRGVRLTWERGHGFSGADVERLLRRYGVRVYARQYATKDGDDYGVTVTTGQGRWAENILRRAGVPLTSPLIDESNRNVQAGRGMPREWRKDKPQKPVGLAGRLLDWLG